MLTGADDELDCNEQLKFHNEMKSTEEGQGYDHQSCI